MKLLTIFKIFWVNFVSPSKKHKGFWTNIFSDKKKSLLRFCPNSSRLLKMLNSSKRKQNELSSNVSLLLETISYRDNENFLRKMSIKYSKTEVRKLFFPCSKFEYFLKTNTPFESKKFFKTSVFGAPLSSIIVCGNFSQNTDR